MFEHLIWFEVFKGKFRLHRAGPLWLQALANFAGHLCKEKSLSQGLEPTSYDATYKASLVPLNRASVRNRETGSSPWAGVQVMHSTEGLNTLAQIVRGTPLDHKLWSSPSKEQDLLELHLQFPFFSWSLKLKSFRATKCWNFQCFVFHHDGPQMMRIYQHRQSSY